jgi:hypothetical protein
MRRGLSFNGGVLQKERNDISLYRVIWIDIDIGMRCDDEMIQIGIEYIGKDVYGQNDRTSNRKSHGW